MKETRVRLWKVDGLAKKIVIDNGTEYTSEVLHRLFLQNGVHLHFLSPRRPIAKSKEEFSETNPALHNGASRDSRRRSDSRLRNNDNPAV